MSDRTCAHCNAQFSWPQKQSQPRKFCFDCLPPMGTIDAKPWMRQQANLQHFSRTGSHGKCCKFDHTQVGPPAPFYCAVCRVAHWGPSKGYCRDCKSRGLRGTTYVPARTSMSCVWCGWTFATKGRGRPTDSCSPGCATANRTGGSHGTPPNSTRMHVVTCRKCGVLLRCADRHQPSAVCVGCRARNMVDINRRKNNKRRGARIDGRYTLAEIALRDGGKCHLCRKRVDMSLSGMDPRGPNIDHLVPVSAGGDDSPANVRLAHRDCNNARGVNGEVQLLLVG